MRNYKETVIYKIVCNDLNIKDCYVGSTTDFIRRKHAHKRNSKTLNYKVYQFINNNGGWDNFQMLEIEKFPCSDGNEMRTRERYWLEQLNATLNKIVPIITEDRKEYKKQQDKEYRENNVERCKLNKQNYQQLNKESIKEKKKVYYENNKESWVVKGKEYYEKNLDKIKAYREKQITCECGGHYTPFHKTRHFRTTLHQEYIKKNI